MAEVSKVIKTYRYERSMQQLQLKLLSFEPATKTILYHHPGLPYDAFDINGNPSIQCLLFTCMISHFNALTTPVNDKGEMSYFNLMDCLKHRDLTFFSTGVQLSVAKDMYDQDTCLKDLLCELNPFGKSRKGITFKTSLFTHNKDKLLVSGLVTYCPVMISTRKKCPIPIDIEESFPENQKWASYNVNLLSKPEYVFTTTGRVTYSQIDLHGHMSFLYYYDHVIDAIILGLKTGDVFKQLIEEDTRCGVGVVELTHMRECVLGQVLDIAVWEGAGTCSTSLNEVRDLISGHESSVGAGDSRVSGSRKSKDDDYSMDEHENPEIMKCKEDVYCMDKHENMKCKEDEDYIDRLRNPDSMTCEVDTPTKLTVPVMCLIEVQGRTVFQASLQFYKHQA